jgi:hypothetical protein
VSIEPITAAAALSTLVSVVCFAVALSALRRRRVLAGASGALLGLLLLAVAGLFAVVTLSVQGYRALTHEELAAVVHTRPTGPQSFEASFELADGSTRRYVLAGDEFYVDARILKWHPWANVLGLHTAYELDRVSGRYARLEDERDKPRTLYSLAGNRPVDAFTLRRTVAWLAPVIDAEYGSATFIAASHPARYEVRVSTTGLLVREVEGGEGGGDGLE